MRNSQKRGFLPYLISGLFVIALAALYIGLRDFLNQTLVDQYLILTDAFSIPGMLLILLGCLIWATDLGGFYGIGYVFNYAMKSIMSFVVPGALGQIENYHDYVFRKKAEGHITGYGFLFITGGISLVISFVFMYLFYQLY